MTLPNAVVKNVDEGGQIGSQKGGSIQLTRRQNEILSLIEKDNQISKRQLAQILKINHSAVDKHIESLKSKGVLEKIGGTRGHWQVNLPE